MGVSHITLGSGIYSIPDAALILRVPLPKLRRWVANSRLYKDGMLQSYGEGRERVLDFNELIEAYTVYTLRDKGVSFQKIRTAHSALAVKLKCEFPFAMRGILTDKKYVLFDENTCDDDAYINLNQGNQREFKSLIDQFCRKVEFCEETQLAERYWPLGKDKAIMVDPHHGFGRPVVAGTNISAQAIFSLYNSGESEEDIAWQYEIGLNAVHDAVEFYKDAA